MSKPQSNRSPLQQELSRVTICHVTPFPSYQAFQGSSFTFKIDDLRRAVRVVLREIPGRGYLIKSPDDELLDLDDALRAAIEVKALHYQMFGYERGMPA